jgi:menaquinone-9 beta-reductase
VPNLMLLEPIFKACEKKPEARRTLLEAFTGDAPVYNLLKHPGMLARALQNSLTERIRS